MIRDTEVNLNDIYKLVKDMAVVYRPDTNQAIALFSSHSQAHDFAYDCGNCEVEIFKDFIQPIEVKELKAKILEAVFF